MIIWPSAWALNPLTGWQQNGCMSLHTLLSCSDVSRTESGVKKLLIDCGYWHRYFDTINWWATTTTKMQDQSRNLITENSHNQRRCGRHLDKLFVVLLNLFCLNLTVNVLCLIKFCMLISVTSQKQCMFSFQLIISVMKHLPVPLLSL